jgi:uncharacterized protein
VIAVDTNLLVYLHRAECAWHAPALRAITALLESDQPSAIPWPCVHEFLGVVTRDRIFRPPSTTAQAIGFIESLLESPRLVLLGETAAHWPTLRGLLMKGQIAGPQVHDARIAAICLQHGVTELWSADRDFSRFPKLKVVNPLIPV